VLRLCAFLLATPVAVFGCGAPEKPTEAAPQVCARNVAASFAPELGADIFRHDESHTIGQAFLNGLAAYYANPKPSTLCALFTPRGWQSALDWDVSLFDSRLAALRTGNATFREQHILRLANEGQYDLQDRPILLPLDIVFDIPAGASQLDAAGHVVDATRNDVRTGLHVDFTYNGRMWVADRVAPLTRDTVRWATMPTPVPPMGPCSEFVRDAGQRDFDNDATRRWCDGDGRGRNIDSSTLVMFTKYPCDAGHAAIVSIGATLGGPLDPLNGHAYVRDPAGEFLAHRWITEPFDRDAKLPADARHSGWTNGNIAIWISPGEFERAIYVVRGQTVERWPRTVESWGVIDCN
jgi:hypothetical protein